MIKTSVPNCFKTRREKLSQLAPRSVFILPGNAEILRNEDVHFAFRQESNLYYLTGYDEPDAWMVLQTGASAGGPYRMTFFSRERNQERELWDGARYGTEGASQVFGAHESHPIGQLRQKLPELLKGAEQIYYRLGVREAHDRIVLDALESARLTFGRSGRGLRPIRDPKEAIGEMRLFKDAFEIENLRKAGEISALAHVSAIRECKPKMNEREIEALIDYACRRHGCLRMGYGSIVAGGKNACCLHYRDNNEVLEDGQLILIDAAGEYDYYTADITRTWPVGKSFTREQAEVYQIVLDAQKAIIGKVKPGMRYSDMHAFAIESMTEGLLQKGIVKGRKDDLISTQGFKRYFPHGTGHWLGMDVHDVGLYQIDGESRVLEPGMVFTVEPGIYFQTYDQAVDAKYRGIGVRIEDDILVTASGSENLTAGVAKEIADIEALKR